MIGVDILVLAGASPSAVGVSLDVLDAANKLARKPAFDHRVLSTETAGVALRGGLSIASRPLARTRARDLVIVPGLGAATREEAALRIAQPDAVRAAAWLKAAWQGGATVASSCTGVFVLGAAGLLDRRQCTTTWWLVPHLQSLFPASEPSRDAMLTEDRRVWTAGAALAHIDLMLGLVARFAGPALAEETARHLVVERRASQARYVIPAFLAARDPLAGRIERYVRTRLARPVSLAELAEATATTSRTLSRRLVAATGMAPMKFVQKIRVDAALHLLQTTRLPMPDVAEQVGFADQAALYRLIVRHTGSPPSAFRR